VLDRYSYVLFDLDGVLVDACEWHFESLNRALNDVAGIEITRRGHEHRFNGLPTKVKLTMLNIVGEEFSRVWDLKQEYTLKVIEERARIMPEKIELLNHLRSNNVKIACVTNSIRKTAEKMLSTTGQLDLVDLLIANEDVERNKPYPDCYNLAVKVLNADPDKTLCVEDSEAGVKAAQSSVVKNLWKVSGYDDVNLKNYLEIVK
jgi:HAD superfamily hydrolase (TIGR01509 family)